MVRFQFAQLLPAICGCEAPIASCVQWKHWNYHDFLSSTTHAAKIDPGDVAWCGKPRNTMIVSLHCLRAAARISTQYPQQMKFRRNIKLKLNFFFTFQSCIDFCFFGCSFGSDTTKRFEFHSFIFASYDAALFSGLKHCEWAAMTFCLLHRWIFTSKYDPPSVMFHSFVHRLPTHLIKLWDMEAMVCDASLPRPNQAALRLLFSALTKIRCAPAHRW